MYTTPNEWRHHHEARRIQRAAAHQEQPEGPHLDYGTTLTIRTDASADFKHKLDELYTSLNFHPASVRIDRRMYDDKERIIYIFSRT